MSIKVMTWVWDNAEISGADLLLLLAIADHCNDEGECYPSVKRLAKMARVSDTHAQTLIRKLKDAKDISVVLNAGIETGRGATNRYYINGYRQFMGLAFIASTPTVRKPDELKKPPKKSWGIADNTPTVSSTPTGIADNTSGVLPIVPKPSVEPSVEPIIADKPQVDKEEFEAFLLAVEKILKIEGTRRFHYFHLLHGTSTKKQWEATNNYFRAKPMTSMELLSFGAWYVVQCPNASAPTSPDVLEDWVSRYRKIATSRVVSDAQKSANYANIEAYSNELRMLKD